MPNAPKIIDTLQRRFDRLVGIAHCEAALCRRAQQIFCAPTRNLGPLERPACWRRPARIQARRRSRALMVG